MSNDKIMPWIDQLTGERAAEFRERRDQIAATVREAEMLELRAKRLRQDAYEESLSLEGRAKGHWSIAVVEGAKSQCNRGQRE